MSNAVQILASASRLALAGAIVYLALQLAGVVQHWPRLAQTVDRLGAEIPATRAEIGLIREEVAQVRELVPGVLGEIAEVRALVPGVLGEIAQVRGALPGVLARLDAIEAQVAPILKRVDDSVAVIKRSNDQLPRVLATADRAITTVDRVRADLTPLAPRVLDEVKFSREAIDPTLDRVHYLVDDAYAKAKDAIGSAEDAGQGASEGALTGLVTGMFKLPFKLIGTLVSPIFGGMPVDIAARLTEQDLALIAEAGDRLRESATAGRTERWFNPVSKHGGDLTLVRRYRLQRYDCVEVRVRITVDDKTLLNKLGNYCRTDGDQWVQADRLLEP